MKTTLFLPAALPCLAVPFVGCGGGSPREDSSSGPARSAITGPLPEKGDLLFVLRGQGSVGGGETSGGAAPGQRRRTRGENVIGDPQADARLKGGHNRIEVKADAVE